MSRLYSAAIVPVAVFDHAMRKSPQSIALDLFGSHFIGSNEIVSLSGLN